MTIRAVLFDADGVLIWPWRFRQYLEREHAITPAMTRGFFRGVFVECMLGQADLRAVLPPFLQQWQWRHSLDEFLDQWFAIEAAVDSRMVETIQALRATGLRCGLATSQERYRAEYLATRMGFATLFDDLFFSCQVGAIKPDRAFYEHIAQVLQLEGSHLLFWDDAPQNVEAARACGWQAEVYTSFEEFAVLLSQYVSAKDSGV